MLRFVSVLAVFFLICSLDASEIRNKLMKIPLKDREKIEQLFSFFVSREGLGYVLFQETKPGCFISLPLTHKSYVMPYKVDNPIRFQRNIGLCWRIWSYYSHLFKHPKILICEEYERINGGMYLQLSIFNKETLKSLLEMYHDDFAERLGTGFTPQKFIAKLEKNKRLRSLIQNDDKLLGLLLGFGRESSQAFKDMISGVELESPLKKVSHRPAGCCINPVSFRGNPDSLEVKKLIEIYTHEIQKIEKIYKNDQFLLITLEALCRR